MKRMPTLHYSVDLRIQTSTEPVPLKYGKLCTKYPSIYGFFTVYRVYSFVSAALSSHSTTPTPTSSSTFSREASRECRRVVQLATGITIQSRVSDVSARILARMSVSVSVSASWNASFRTSHSDDSPNVGAKRFRKVHSVVSSKQWVGSVNNARRNESERWIALHESRATTRLDDELAE